MTNSYYISGDSFVYTPHGYIELDRLFRIQNTDKRTNIKEVEIAGFQKGVDIVDKIEHISQLPSENVETITLKLEAQYSNPYLIESFPDQLMYKIINLNDKEDIEKCRFDKLIMGDYVLVQGGKMKVIGIIKQITTQNFYTITTRKEIPTLFVNKIILVNSKNQNDINFTKSSNESCEEQN